MRDARGAVTTRDSYDCGCLSWAAAGHARSKCLEPEDEPLNTQTATQGNAAALALSPEELAHYRRDGFLVRKWALAAQDLETVRAAVEAAATTALALTRTAAARTYFLDGKRFVDHGSRTIQFEHAPGSKEIKVVEPVQDLDARLETLARDTRLTDPVRSILGTARLSLWTAKLNLKRAGVGSGFGWHQDSPYWVHDCRHSVDDLPNVMVALDDADATNGCFRVIRGSHTRGCLPGTDDGTQLGGFYTSPDSFELADQVALEVPAGSLIWFDPHIVHGSLPNRSRQPRRALVLSYQPAGYPSLKSGSVLNLD